MIDSSSMASLHFDLTHSLDFPTHPKPYSIQEHDTYTTDNDDDTNKDSRARIDNLNDSLVNNHIDNLNDTLLELIFARLSEWRHLTTSKCVSKRWNSIISNPDFFRHLRESNKILSFTLFLQPYYYGCQDVSLISEHLYFRRHKLCLDFIPKNGDTFTRIVAHHNDLLVLFHTRSSRKASYYIANPLTKQFIGLPITSFNIAQSCVCGHGLAGIVNGLSTVDVINGVIYSGGFRVVRISHGDSYRTFIEEIYYSDTNQWETYRFDSFGFKFKPLDGKLDNNSVSCNNKVYWLGVSQILVVDPFRDNIVAPFVLNLPKEIYEESVLGVCQNCLRIAQFETHWVNPRIKVWEFEGYDALNNRWGDLKLVIDFELKPYIFERVFSPTDIIFLTKKSVICCHPNDPGVVYLIYGHKLLRCNVFKMRFKLILHPDTDSDLCSHQRFQLVHPLTDS